jgi:hypothetical protein
MIDHRQRGFIVLNAVGGALVLGSYAWGAFGGGAAMSGLWGGVPESIRPLYVVNMLLAAAGYFAFVPYVTFRIDPERRDLLGGADYRIFHVWMALVLLPSAAWLPLTAAMIAAPGMALWWLIRIDLGLVAIGSLGMLVTLAALPPPRPAGRVWALVGLVPFCLQTAVLDALVWPAFFQW